MSTNDDDKATMITQRLPIRMTSRVVRGFGRGSSDLGIPTANLDLQAEGSQSWSVPDKSAPTLQDLPTGIYWGFARIAMDQSNGDTTTTDKTTSTREQVYTAAISIGYNPTYGNEQKTIEPHLIAPEGDPCRHASSCGETVLGDFYEQAIRLAVCGYLRPELPFEGLDKLTQAIKKDIVQAVEFGQKMPKENAAIQKELDWVGSTEAASSV